jgi:hypothetical protein
MLRYGLGARSALGYGLGVARAGGAAGYKAYCTFNDADATLLTNYSWTNAGDVRPSVNQWGGAYNFACTSGRAALPVGTGGGLTTLDCGAADGLLAVSLIVASSSSIVERGLIFRYTSITTYWVAGLRYNTNKWGIFEHVSGAVNERAVQAFTVAPGTDYSIAVLLSGNDITATLNGANTQTYNSATGASKTVHGLRARYTGDTFNNFSLT